MENKYNLNYFNFRKFGQEYLLTNDLGKFIFLKEKDFKKLLHNKLEKNSNIYNELLSNYFIYDTNKEIFIRNTSSKIRKSKSYLFERTQLHIFILTVNCNMNCIYCQASAKNIQSKKLKMNFDIAEKAVDIALQSTSKHLSFEFQGGEPLLNFDTLKHIVEYTKQKNINQEKQISFNLVSNLTLLTEDIMEFLINNNVNICTSIDGNSTVHNYNRPMNNKPTLYITQNNMELINKEYLNRNINRKVGAIETTTKKSLSYPKQIIDQYIKLGINNIFIRPLTPIGFSIKNWDVIGYTPEEFCEFYKKCLDYILELSLKGITIVETQASIFLKKILENKSINYMELRSPCGGGIGQLAYNYDGNIYSCDEARMLAESGDKSFKLGNVHRSMYEQLINNPVTKSICISSCLETLPSCSECIYHPYCGTCPVYNYIEQKSIFGKMPISYRCKINKGILNILFAKIKEKDEKIMQIFKRWAN
ncbi:His-Xaa-Ser system radical SAM maturase HxsB (plasmid) [Haloimpatiens sp. FM7330]|uniref:His-Xaa-Ser system radical SAM maturase HxsB n=1 Tax=Haloimpatiens sp. FM7330 TaxID=3298610 RepID=UPI0036300D11